MVNSLMSQVEPNGKDLIKSDYIFEGKVLNILPFRFDDKNYISYKISVIKNLKTNSIVNSGDTIELISILPESWGVLDNGEFYKKINYDHFAKSSQKGLAADINSFGVFFAEKNELITSTNISFSLSLIPSFQNSDSYFNIIPVSFYNESLKKRETKYTVEGFNKEFNNLSSFNDYLKNLNLPPLSIEENNKKKDVAFQIEREKNKAIYEKRLENKNSIDDKLNLKRKQKHPATQRAIEYITFEIQNEQLTGAGNQFFEFDIMVNGSSSDTYLDNSAFVIEFNTFAFGVNLSANNLVTISKGVNFDNSTYYDPMDFVTDDSPNAIRFGLGLDYDALSWNRTQLTTSPQTLLHLKFELLDCSGFADLTFSDITNVSFVDFYTTNPTEHALTGTFYSYDDPDYIQPNNYALCPPPSITSFFPTSISSGTNSILTINGYGFGNNRGFGQVQFPEANDGGNTYSEYLNGIDYVSWSDTEIKINLPFLVDSTNQYFPGSGIFKVVTDDNQVVTSPFPVNITYAAYNLGISPGTPNFRKVPVRHVDNSSFFDGYAREFYLDTSITNNPIIDAIVRKSLRDWSCATTINWIIKDTIMQQGHLLDGKSIIFLEDIYQGNPLAKTESLDGAICTDASTNEEFLFFNETDISISRGFNGPISWFYDTTMTLDLPLNHHDFYSTIQHELGHAHYLGHVINTTDLLYYGEDAGPTNASDRYHLYSSYNSIDGGIYITSESQGINVFNCSGISNISPLILDFCGDLSLQSLSGQTSQIDVYPNPFISGININFNNASVQSVSYSVTDIMGKIVLTSPNKNISTQYVDQINLDFISEGIYIVTLNINSVQQTIKIIKK